MTWDKCTPAFSLSAGLLIKLQKQMISHGKKTKQRHKHSHGRMSKQKNKHLPRINTELHGKDRSRDTEGRISRSIATELHGRKKKRKN